MLFQSRIYISMDYKKLWQLKTFAYNIVTFVFILACECNAIGINNDVCDVETGQCDCKTNYGQRQCDACADGYFNFPSCSGRNY